MTTLTIEQLLQKAQQAVESKKRKRRHSQHLKNYITKHNIDSGVIPVPNYALFYHYRHSYFETKGLLSKIEFFRLINNMFKFPKKRKDKQRFYLLNTDLGINTDELIKKALIYNRFYETKRKKKVQLSEKERNSQESV